MVLGCKLMEQVWFPGRGVVGVVSGVGINKWVWFGDTINGVGVVSGGAY